MPTSPDISAVADHFRRAIAAGRMPHALIVSGRPRGGGLAATEAILHLLYDTPGAPTDLYKNVDIRWIEPESKSRQIRAEEARSLIDFLSLTSYEGGWKACVILFADRLNPDAQNILLKTLEEPPPNSLLVLVTATPSALLATVRSRAQTVDVAETEDLTRKPWYPHVLDLLRNPPARRPTDVLAWSDQLLAPLAELEDRVRAEEEQRATAAAEAEVKAPAKGKSRKSPRASAPPDDLPKVAKDTIEARVATRVKEEQEELLSMVQNWQRDVLACLKDPAAPPLHFPSESQAILAQTEGLAFPAALRRVTIVEDIRDLLIHNIRPAAALPRLARALAQP
jgi:DNA polymerase-3 subunit delta'